MARKETLDYIQEELSFIKRRLKEFIEYGFDPSLSPLVDAMEDYKLKLSELEAEELKSELKRKGLI